VGQEKKQQLVWSGRPAHTIINERFHRHEFGVSFFAQPQDEQAEQLFLSLWEFFKLLLNRLKF